MEVLTKSTAQRFVMLLFIGSLCSSDKTYIVQSPAVRLFPHDIPQDVTKIVVQGTKIKAIDYIEPFPNLTKMFLGKNSLTQFPDLSNVSNNLQQCFLSSNNIAAVDFIPKLKMLQVLALGANKLTRLPDLTNISGSLEELYLEDNQIFVVDGIARMLVLRILTLTSNRLTEFPDLDAAGSVLQELDLVNNSIKNIPNRVLKPLVALKRLHLGNRNDEQFPVLPNICAMGRNRMSLAILLYSNQTICGISAVYVKLALEAGRLRFESTVGLTSLVCDEPRHLAGNLLMNINVTEMLGKPNFYLIHY